MDQTSLDQIADALLAVGRRLVSQGDAHIIVPPRAHEQGFWFGGGDVCCDADGSLLICGRYRNGGDSRVGIEAGPRGAELAILRSTDGGRTFSPVASLLKADVAPAGQTVLSIEGASLRRTPGGLELFVSSEKQRDYPEHLRDAQKPGTGVWTIDALRADTVDGLTSAPAQPVLASNEPAGLHVKDPVAFQIGGRAFLLYCTHPFSWTSSNTAVAELDANGQLREMCPQVLPRGPVWDVAVCRITARLAMPRAGMLADLPPLSLYFYDGAECIHDHSDGGRPRGYSCEEIGGLAAGFDDDFPRLTRLSVGAPAFVSPHGTGCSRYVSVFEGDDEYLVTWQQSQPDGSQPLVANHVARSEVLSILGA